MAQLDRYNSQTFDKVAPWGIPRYVDSETGVFIEGLTLFMNERPLNSELDFGCLIFGVECTIHAYNSSLTAVVPVTVIFILILAKCTLCTRVQRVHLAMLPPTWPALIFFS